MTPRSVPPRIAFLVDHPRRDLAGIVLTAMALCERGFLCYLVPLNLRETETFALRPDHVVLNFARRGSEAFAEALGEAGIGMSVLETEGVVWSNDEEYAAMFWARPELRARIHAACIWGPRLAGELVRRGIYTSAQAQVTGCPRYDFYHPSLRRALAPDEKSGRNGSATVLVNTNFSLTNSRFVPLAQNLVSLRAATPITEQQSEEWARVEQGALRATIDMVKCLARDFPAASIVLRPHPFEDATTYESALAGAPNVRIDGSGPVLARLVASDVLIQRSCTTGVEAAMLDKPTLSPLWITPPYLFEVAEAVSQGCESYGALRDGVTAVIEGRYHVPETVAGARATVIPESFHTIDGLAHERVAAALATAAQAPRRIRPDVCDRFLYRLQEATGSRGDRAGRLLRRRLGLNPNWSFRRMRVVPEAAWTTSDKAFGVAEVRSLVDRIQGVRGDPARASAVRVESAAERGEMVHGFRGHSITIAPS